MPTSEEKLASFLERNQKYAETYPEPPPLSRGIERNKRLGLKSTVVISCADPRIHPEKYLALNFSESAIIRNAGGRTQDVMRSLLSLDAIGGVGTVLVIHHTDCGMMQTNEKGFHHRVEAKHPAIEAGRTDSDYGAIADPYQTIIEDVNYLKSYPSIVENMDVYGLVLDTFTGILKQIV